MEFLKYDGNTHGLKTESVDPDSPRNNGLGLGLRENSSLNIRKQLCDRHTHVVLSLR